MGLSSTGRPSGFFQVQENFVLHRMGGVFEAGKDILFCQMRIILEDFAFSYPGGKKFQDKLNRYSGPLDDGLSP
jgi:hypothetical protein